MAKYSKNLLVYVLGIILIVVLAIANWYWPLYSLIQDSAVYRFIWLGIFFILLDALFEFIIRIIKKINCR